MQYILITSKGRVYTFSVLECAEIYKSAFGGTLITKDIANSEEQYETENS